MSEISLPTLGARVRHYRERLGLSQEELALSVGAAQQTIQSLESGKIRKSTFLPHLAKVLGVDLDYLLSGTDQNLTVQAAKPITIATVRRVPLFTTLDFQAVSNFLQDQTVESPSGKWVSMDYTLPFAESGSRLFALKLSLGDEVFQPEFRPGDQLVIDPDAAIQPSDPVVVYQAGSERLNLKRYRVLSQSKDGVAYELASIHPDFPSVAGTELQSVQILGLVLQVRRPVATRVRLAVLEEQYR